MASAREALFTVRRAGHADAHGILDCLRSAFEPYRSSYSTEAFADTVPTPEALERRLDEMIILAAADSSGKIIGTVALSLVSSEEGHIRGMAVRPGWQGRGVAEALLSQVEFELRERKVSRLSLDTTEPLRRAIHFYEKHGFRASGTVKNFFGMPLLEYVKAI